MEAVLRREIGSTLGYRERALRLCARLREGTSDGKVEKMVTGVIDKNAIGHAKDLQRLRLFRALFDMECRLRRDP